MGVYIKMEMPRSCYECRFNNGSMCYAMRDDNDYILNENTDTKRHSNCPLVEIKTPHGRLIDEDALIDDLIEQKIPFNAGVNESIIMTPTILEAEKQ